MRRSHRLALSAAALGFGLALGGAGTGIDALRSHRAEPRTGGDATRRDARAGRGAESMQQGVRARGGTRATQASAATGVTPPDAAPRARRAAAPAALVVPIALDAARARGVALEVGGRDPAAPRALDLWRIEADGRRARIARGHSEADGSLVFPPLMLPGRSIELVATPQGVLPDHAAASRPIVVRRDPAAPRVEATPDADGVVLRVEAAESGGSIVIESVESPARAAGEVATVARVPVAVTADAAPTPLEIALDDARGVALAVVQIDPDGRRSPPRLVFVDVEQPKQE